MIIIGHRICKVFKKTSVWPSFKQTFLEILIQPINHQDKLLQIYKMMIFQEIWDLKWYVNFLYSVYTSCANHTLIRREISMNCHSSLDRYSPQGRYQDYKVYWSLFQLFLSPSLEFSAPSLDAPFCSCPFLPLAPTHPTFYWLK